MRRGAKLLAIGILACSLETAPTASGAVNLTGEYTLQVSGGLGSYTAVLTVRQSGTQLTAEVSGVQGLVVGTIDPDAGTFHIPVRDTPGGPFGFPPCRGNRIDGIASPDRQTIEGTQVSHYLAGLGRCVDIGGPFTGTRDATACGDGVVDPGEQCDYGGLADGDCCSLHCQAVDNTTPCGTTCAPATCSAGSCVPDALPPAGTGCTDGDACTTEDACDGAGTCRGTACDGCSTCVPTVGCQDVPDPACTAAGNRASVRLDVSARLFFFASNGSATLDFRDPLTSTDFTACVFSFDGVAWDGLLTAQVPAGGTCQGAPCWRGSRTGAAYRNSGRTHDGLARVVLRETSARPGVTLRGSGPNLDVPSQLPAAMSSVRVELRGADAQGRVCYATDFTEVAHSPLRVRGLR